MPPYKITRKQFIKNTSLAGLGMFFFPALTAKLGKTIHAQPRSVNPSEINCILSPNQTGGPFYLPPEFDRQDITEGLPGHPMLLNVKVVDANTCEPIPNALVNVWHCDAEGVYSQFGAVANETWLRGYQITDCNGDCLFHTIFPGWYPGRVVHIHFDVHVNGGSTKVSQMYFPDNIDDEVYTNFAPYNTRTDGVSGGPVNPTDNASDFVSEAALNALLVDTIDGLQFDGNGEPLAVEASFVAGLDMTGLTADTTGCTGVPVSLKVLLEGPYENGSMRTDLGNLIPANQPYNVAPYNYTGSETLNAILSDMVDWVLVEARTGTPNASGTPGTTVIERQAAVLLADGSIVGVDGINPIRFNLTPGEMVYFAIRHRNHLDVLSATAVEVTDNMVYDFTTATTQAWGVDQLKLATDGKAVMYTGDINSDAVIQNTDYDAWKENPAVLDTYDNTDTNLDGIVQVTDYDKWYNNRSKVGSNEIQ